MKEDLDYWKRRCELAEKYISESPCDPDIYEEQYKAYNKWCEFKKLPIPSVSKRLDIGSKVCMIAHKNITGQVVGRSDIGFNHWMVKWDRTGKVEREYGADIVVC